MQVFCTADYSGCDHPNAFLLQENRLIVHQITKEWREPGTKHYQAITDDDDHFKLVFCETSGKWSILKVSILLSS
jgi:hypothetical protein